jgi:hypothetical protein
LLSSTVNNEKKDTYVLETFFLSGGNIDYRWVILTQWKLENLEYRTIVSGSEVAYIFSFIYASVYCPYSYHPSQVVPSVFRYEIQK